MLKQGLKPLRHGAVLSMAALAVLAAACTPGSDGDKPAAKAPSSVNTDIAKAGDVTLTVWDQEVRGGQNEQMERLNKAFQDKYPNVKIKRVSRSFNDLQKTLRLALSGDSPPDVVEANQGHGAMAQFVKAGMLLPLDNYDQVYGWKKRYPKGLTDLNSVSPDGKKIGTGGLYGVSINGEIVGIYYNKDKLSGLGVQPPKTWADFERALATAKGKGETPIAFGNLDKFPAIHNFGVIQDQLAPKDAVRRLVYGQGGSWTDGPNVQAAQKLSDWVKAGYFTKDANGVKYDDSPVNFSKGEGVFLIGGTWFAADLYKSMGDKVGFMLPPPAQAGGQPTTMGGESLPWSITAKSKHPDVAAAYINFISSPEAMDVSVETGNLPALAAPTKKPQGPVFTDIFGAWDVLSRNDGITPYLDYATPDFADALGGPLQELIAGRTSPRQAMDKAQQNYATFLRK
ncbi:extracellular solute-binding protein [Thermomonospora umbrina]|uniref:Carbohydrate ABC transporter substrate-binding protein (CUT1 family) n=1 Tax=Thermomonospora umbrina TaxID=111806 RepID=A0A3D9TAS9_9ACTN|nr:extracellular solute-binding protein [Thermomonospora umbrina]REF00872.1 carbohydrate ABC transporter substrate-binding protein (CUT1 family) [Thermomonospora umbrina]